ncbi:hypothetical protein Mapa_005934 [Marchantia paleacea]|nr:hypothetical protein Mapa_005934 [Marchantia paleacea]
MTGRSSRLAQPVACAFQYIGNRISDLAILPAGMRAFRSSASESSVALIKQLRERTGAPMKDVKSVLVQCDWDSEAAYTELRKKGLAAAGKKASRVAADGLLGVAQESRAAAVIEINSETDFVARNDLFQHLVSQVAKAALLADLSPGSVGEAAVINMEALESARVELSHPKLSGRSTVSDAVAEVASIMGENVKLRRGFHMSSSSGVVYSYLHSSTHKGLARVVGLLSLEPQESPADSQSGDHPAELSSLGESIAMHIVAQRPLFLSKDLVAEESLQHERNILTSQALASGKPANVVEKMVSGRLSKYVQEVALLQQKYVLDESKTVQSVLNDASKQLQRQYSIGRFLRMEVGEGIPREEKNFAAEVAAQAA